MGHIYAAASLYLSFLVLVPFFIRTHAPGPPLTHLSHLASGRWSVVAALCTDEEVTEGTLKAELPVCRVMWHQWHGPGFVGKA